MDKVSVVQFGGDLTPEQSVLEALPYAKTCSHALVVLQQKNGDITVSYSSGSHMEKVGMLELAKYDLLKGMQGK